MKLRGYMVLTASLSSSLCLAHAMRAQGSALMSCASRWWEAAGAFRCGRCCKASSDVTPRTMEAETTTCIRKGRTLNAQERRHGAIVPDLPLNRMG